MATHLYTNPSSTSLTSSCVMTSEALPLFDATRVSPRYHSTVVTSRSVPQVKSIEVPMDRSVWSTLADATSPGIVIKLLIIIL